MNIFSEIDYRKIIRDTVRSRKKLDRHSSFSRLSERSRVQNTYLSKALRGHAELSADQLYAICVALGFSADEREYMALLLEFARSAHMARKSELKEKIRAVQARHLRSEEHLRARAVQISSEGIQEYYLDPLHQIVHVCLTVERYQKEPELLAEALKLRPERVVSLIQTLERLGIVERKGNKVVPRINGIHLPQDSPVFSSWRSQLRTRSFQCLQDAKPGEAYSFSVVFSADPATREKLQALFLDYLKSVEGLVDQTQPVCVYQMNFDLHPWTQSE
jgi:uncharacterized protein (TIGR02147 family)